MKRLACLAAMLALAIGFTPPALATEIPDAWVRDLWIKATGLPADAVLEDATFANNTPSFIYSFGQGPDGRLVPEGMITAVAPAVTIGVERVVPPESVSEQIFNLDKEVLFPPWMSKAEAEEVKDLKFAAAPDKISARFTYPCHMATYTHPQKKIGRTILFIQTDSYLFTVTVSQILRDDEHGYIPAKEYSAADIETWLMNLELAKQ